jgi:hypothetical protein
MITNISILREYIITNKCTLPQRAIPAAVVGDLKLLFFIDRTSIMLYRSLLHKIYIYMHTLAKELQEPKVIRRVIQETISSSLMPPQLS